MESNVAKIKLLVIICRLGWITKSYGRLMLDLK